MKVVLENVTKIFGQDKSGAGFKAVNDFSLEIPDGTLVALLGPSGCGKSTCLNMISGLLMPSSGKIFFGDEDVTETQPENREVGMVFQSYALYPHLTVLQNIIFPLQNKKMPKDEMLKRADEVARMVDISHLMNRKPKELSGGQQQRVAIARALVKSPRVLLLDEPLSNLDARLRLQTREEIRRVQRATGITTVFVTHDQEEALSISDLIVVMNEGVLQQLGAPQSVYDDPVNLFVARFLGTPPINVFKARANDGQLYVGDDRICAVLTDDGELPDGELTLAVRPEGLVPSPDGVLSASLSRVEVMGRDTSVVFTHGKAENAICRAIVASDAYIPSGDSVAFEIRPEKAYLFRADGTRIRCSLDFGTAPTEEQREK